MIDYCWKPAVLEWNYLNSLILPACAHQNVYICLYDHDYDIFCWIWTMSFWNLVRYFYSLLVEYMVFVLPPQQGCNRMAQLVSFQHVLTESLFHKPHTRPGTFQTQNRLDGSASIKVDAPVYPFLSAIQTITSHCLAYYCCNITFVILQLWASHIIIHKMFVLTWHIILSIYLLKRFGLYFIRPPSSSGRVLMVIRCCVKATMIT